MRGNPNGGIMIRTKRTLLILGLVLFVSPLPAQEKGFSVKAKTQAVLEKEAGIGERYALLIGISKYANSTIDLAFAESDAQALYDLLMDPQIGAYKAENVRLLLNEQATLFRRRY